MTTSKDSKIAAEIKPPYDLDKRGRRLWLGVILAVYLIVTAMYSVVVPLFETPDEHWHYFTAQYIAENGRLPYVAPGDSFDEWMRQEAAQAPLYYLLSALLINPIDTSNAREEAWPNKFASMGDAGDLININQFVHTQDEAWPWQGYTLAAHLLRIFSTLLGAGTLLCIYLAGRLLWPDDAYRALLATALVALLPQYNFHHAAVTNDSLIIFLISAALWQLIRMWQTEITRWRLLLLGLTIGLAALTKNTGLTLLLYAVGVLFLLAVRDVSKPGTDSDRSELAGWRLLGWTALLVILPTVLIAGWVWIRNQSLYGDFTAMNQFVRLAGGDRNYTLIPVLLESRGLWLSSFAIFGWFNIRAPNWVYWFWSGLAILAVIGGGWRILTNIRRRGTMPRAESSDKGFPAGVKSVLNQSWFLPFLLAMWLVAIYGSLVLFMLQTEAAQGRLLFPALLPVALGMAAGLTAMPLFRRLSPLFLAAALFITVYCLFYVVRPAYEKPSTVVELPSDAVELDVEMGLGLKLVGALLESEEVLPGEPLWLTLYWRADDVQEDAPEYVLSVFGRDNEEIGKVHSYHGRGLYPAGLWPNGQIVADRFGLWIDEPAQAPVLARIDTTILEGDTARVAEIKVVPHTWPLREEEMLAQIGPAIDLLNIDAASEPLKPGDELQVDVLWQASGELQADYTTLLHLGQPDQTPLATADRPPLDGRYPTHVWESGEQIDDSYTLIVPDGLAPGRYPLWIGMYDPKTSARLPIMINGEAQPFDVYLAGWIEIE